jgi:bacteriophage N4 adsorption protein B
METLQTVFLVLAYTAAIGFFIFGLDDVLFDLQYLRRLRGKRSKPPVPLETLLAEPEKLIAVFIPAWNEGGIVNRMADYARRTLQYDHYDLFIGVYANDAETNRCVDELVKTSPRIHKAVVPHDGPTSKGDCLNHIHRAMEACEIPGRREYLIIALHDAEDILHPLTLKVYNHYVPVQLDMGQLPVFPLELTPWIHWVGNTYLDEFAELHTKDMYAREAIGGVVPSAGVGTAFSRRAIDFLASKNGGNPFPATSLAEDYMVGWELSAAGFRTGFIDHPVRRKVARRDARGRSRPPKTVVERVAVRENFPRRFGQAVRQKARWIMGTAFQGWENAGWRGGLATRYTLMRDRRAPVVHTINAAGYCVVAYMLADFGVRHSELANTVHIRPLFTDHGLLWKIVLVDTALLAYRVGQKAWHVSSLSGPLQGFFSIPRYPLANLINMAATVRASYLYARHRLSGRPLAWAKTKHVFPAHPESGTYARTIEDAVIDEGLVLRKEMEALLEKSPHLSAPRALLEHGVIDEGRFTLLWARHSGLAVETVLPGDLDGELFEKWPEETALRFEALPVRESLRGDILLAFAEPPAERALRRCTEILDSPVEPVLVRPSNLHRLRHRIYPRLALRSAASDPLAGFLQSLSSGDLGRLREFQGRSGGDEAAALAALRLASAEELRDLFARAWRAEPADLRSKSLSLSLLRALGPLFCEVHGLLPLHDGSIAVRGPLHPGVAARVRAILGNEAAFRADTPSGFDSAWRKFETLQAASNALLDQLVAEGDLSRENSERIRTMRRVVAGPVDRLLIQFGLVKRPRLLAALRRAGGVETASDTDHHGDAAAAALLAPGFSRRAGVVVSDLSPDGATLRLDGLLAAADLEEVHARCEGLPVRFELFPA